MSIKQLGDSAQAPDGPTEPGSSNVEVKHLERTVAFEYKGDGRPTPPVAADIHERETRAPGRSPGQLVPQLPGLQPVTLPGYDILGELGRGGMGVVYKARHRELNRIVALKMILAGGHAGADDLQRFVGEAEAAATLQHPNIVQVYEIGHHQGLPFMALEYVAGGSLAGRLRGTPLPPSQAARLVKEAALGMHAAHLNGIVHRDLKPGNLLLARIDERRTMNDASGTMSQPDASVHPSSFIDDHSPKITDFGLAKRVQKSSSLTISGAVMGTPSYMAPEQASGDAKRVGPPADIYALGAVLYECLTGRPPFQGPTPVDTVMQVINNEPVAPTQLQPKTPRDLETICLKCLRKEPGKRYESAAALADDLERFLTDRTILARPSGTAEKCWRWCRRNPVVAALAASVAGLLFVLAIGASIAAFLLEHERQELEVANRRLGEARNDAVDKLWRSYLAQARAGRWSGQPGHRFDSLEALAKAAEIRPSLELRNEALACLPLVDLRLDKKWRDYSGSKLLLFDPAFVHYAEPDATGNISVKRTADDVQVSLLPAPKLPPWLMHFSGDGRYLAVKYHLQDSSNQNRVIVWDVKAGKVTQELKQVSYGAMDFSPDGKTFAVGHLDGTVRMLDLARGDLSEPIYRGPLVHTLRYDPSGRKLALSSIETTEVQILDAADGQVLAVLKHAAAVRGLSWRGDGRWLAAAGKDLQVHVWNVAGKPKIQAVLKGHDHEVIQVAFNRRGNLLASISWDSTIRLWDPLTGKQHLTAPHLGPLQFSDDDARLGFFEVANSIGLRRLDLEAKVISFEVHFNPTGDTLVNGMPDGALIWDLTKRASPKQAPPSRMRQPGGNFSTLFRPDGKSAITSGAAGLHRWHVTRTEEGAVRLEAAETLYAGRLGRGAMSGDGRYVAAIADFRRALVYDLNAPAKPVATVSHPHLGYLALSPDGKRLATGAWQGQGVMIWDTRTGKLIKELPIPSSAYVVFSPDSQRLATATADEVCVWHTDSWQLGHERRRERGGPIAFSPHGDLLAYTHTLSTIRLVTSDKGQELATLETPYPLGLSWLSFSNDGEQLAASADTMVQLWNLRALRRELAAMKLDWP